MKSEELKTVDVSIIIANWNTCNILRDCLKSIYAHTGNLTFEVIVIDNASTDGSAPMVRKEFPQVKLIINSENLGFARANNIGIHKSIGRYVCLVNSDVIVKENCFKTLIGFMDNNRTIGIAGPRVLNSDGTLQYSCRKLPTIWNTFCQAVGLNLLFSKSSFFSEPFMKYWPHDEIRNVESLRGCFWLVRRQALDTVGLLDEDFFIYGEDIDWCKRFLESGWEIVFYPDAEAIHYGGASSSIVPLRFFIEMQKADLHYWRKHHRKVGEFSYRVIILVRHLVRLILFAITYLICPTRREATLYKIKRAFTCICWVLKLKVSLD